jgi:hypothetical protein
VGLLGLFLFVLVWLLPYILPVYLGAPLHFLKYTFLLIKKKKSFSVREIFFYDLVSLDLREMR